MFRSDQDGSDLFNPVGLSSFEIRLDCGCPYWNVLNYLGFVLYHHWTCAGFAQFGRPCSICSNQSTVHCPCWKCTIDLLLVVHSVPLAHPLEFCDLFILGDSSGIVQTV